MIFPSCWCLSCWVLFKHMKKGYIDPRISLWNKHFNPKLDFIRRSQINLNLQKTHCRKIKVIRGKWERNDREKEEQWQKFDEWYCIICDTTTHNTRNCHFKCTRSRIPNHSQRNCWFQNKQEKEQANVSKEETESWCFTHALRQEANPRMHGISIVAVVTTWRAILAALWRWTVNSPPKWNLEMARYNQTRYQKTYSQCFCA